VAIDTNTVTSGVKDGVEKNPTFAAFIKRAGREYEAYSATPKEYDAFVQQISKMWASGLERANHLSTKTRLD
jgi:hypothetical protein